MWYEEYGAAAFPPGRRRNKRGTEGRCGRPDKVRGVGRARCTGAGHTHRPAAAGTSTGRPRLLRPRSVYFPRNKKWFSGVVKLGTCEAGGTGAIVDFADGERFELRELMRNSRIRIRIVPQDVGPRAPLSRLISHHAICYLASTVELHR